MIALVCPKFLKNSPEIVWKKTRQSSGQTDEYSPMKKINQFHTQRNLPFCHGSDE